MMQLPSTSLRSLAPILLGALFLMVPVLLNGFPFFFFDTADYLILTPVVHRAPFYPIFLTLFHLKCFIWGPVIAQCVLLSHLVWLMLRRVSGTAEARYYVPLMALLAAFTSLPYFTGFLMADIFTPVMFISLYLLAFHYRDLSKPLRFYLFLLGSASAGMHLSNLPIAMGLCVLLILLHWLARFPRADRLRSCAIIIMPVILAIAAIFTYNIAVFRTATLSPAGQTFMLANMLEHGPARHYLDTACPTKHYRICAYRPFPVESNEILWGKHNLLQHYGGFVGMKDESAILVRETIRTYPDEVAAMVWQNFLNTLMAHEPGKDLHYQNDAPMDNLLPRVFGQSAWHAYDQSAEMRNAVPHQLLRAIDAIVTPMSFFLLILAAILTLRSRGEAFCLSVATLGFVLGDALICGTFSGVFDRYQSRVAWLMPMVLGLFVIDYLKKRRAA